MWNIEIGVGKEWDHKKHDGKEKKIPEYSFDYCLPGDELGYKWTALVGKERMSNSWMANTVPMKVLWGRFRLINVW